MGPVFAFPVSTRGVERPTLKACETEHLYEAFDRN